MGGWMGRCEGFEIMWVLMSLVISFDLRFIFQLNNDSFIEWLLGISNQLIENVSAIKRGLTGAHTHAFGIMHLHIRNESSGLMHAAWYLNSVVWCLSFYGLNIISFATFCFFMSWLKISLALNRWMSEGNLCDSLPICGFDVTLCAIFSLCLSFPAMSPWRMNFTTILIPLWTYFVSCKPFIFLCIRHKRIYWKIWALSKIVTHTVFVLRWESHILLRNVVKILWII